MNFLENLTVASKRRQWTAALANVREALWDEAGPLFDALQELVKQNTPYAVLAKKYGTLQVAFCNLIIVGV